ILGSVYLLGAESGHLNDVYEEESHELEPWQDSPNEVSTYDWRDYLGNPKFLIPHPLSTNLTKTSTRYQRAYLDFFEDQLVLNGYSWRKVLETYLFEGKHPLINNLISGRT
ncbi:MAG: hypothetical protein Q9183_007634, partial [Haloplaca sp. 2 TL-2023]